MSMKRKLKLTAIIQKISEGGYVAFIEEIPGVNTQGETIEETKENLFDALQLSLDFHRQKSSKKLNRLKKGIIREEFEFIAA